MTLSQYDWSSAQLGDHSHAKFKILRTYFSRYLERRCLNPHQGKFRLAIVDGFCGAGKYECGTLGSPLIFLDELLKAHRSINFKREVEGLKPVEFEVFLWFNDRDQEPLELLKSNSAPYIAAINEEPGISIRTEHSTSTFESVYPHVEQFLQAGRFGNVIFNLDQYGYKGVSFQTIKSILTLHGSAEVFLTFAIEALRAFRKKTDLEQDLRNSGITEDDWYITTEKEKLGIFEKSVFETFRDCSPFVSPFCINNPSGWRYWMLHFANRHTARSVYNNVLHENSTSVHFGRFGLRMFQYDQRDIGGLFEFNSVGRENSLQQLPDDVGRLVSEYGDAVSMDEFYQLAFKETPAHSDDIHEAMILNPDIEVLTPNGGQRRKATAITAQDTIQLSSTRTFSFMNESIFENEVLKSRS